ncbi:MAG: peptidoglycan DD-metalloendopeptidase family protein [Chlorobi bacterium]|nr:peptidoglycan DD-metalloendopeptidase family protein [Chlorobiota bacterium]
MKEAPRFLHFSLDRYRVEEDTVRPGQTFGGILAAHGYSPSQTYRLIADLDSLFDPRMLKAGKPYYLIYPKGDTLPEAFVYRLSPADYRVIYLKSGGNKLYEEVAKPIRTEDRAVAVPIRHSLFQDLQTQGLSPKLALKLSEIYAWTVDFFHLRPGDGFKALYEDRYVDSTYLGVGDIRAAVFYHYGDTIYAFKYEYDTIRHLSDYFDERGRTLRKQFLKSPIKFGRISSRYNLRRYVKIYGRVKPHYGTDFAAPVGTPIMATADGVVEVAGYTRGNGNYVKIRHNSTYSTQYLHMRNFAKGIRPGVRVKQGQVIGYVGMTGYTTGPHVCYRFWKNGKQVDPFKEKLPEAKSLDSTQLERYLQFIKPLKQQLDSLAYESPSA